MKLLSKVGALHTLPKPSSAVMDAALGLLAAFGDPQKLKKPLTDMRDVQAHNEQVLKDTTAALADLGKREENLQQERDKHAQQCRAADADFASRQNNAARREQRLDVRISTFDQHEKAQTLEFTERKAELDLGHEDLGNLVRVYETDKGELDKREAKLTEAEQKLNAARTNLKAREAKLRAALNS